MDFSHLCLKPNEVDIIIYHDKCFDGFGSAFSGYYFAKKIGKTFDYYGASYGSQIPIEKLKNKNVLLCDFSYKKDDMILIKQKANKIVVLDHHISAEKQLKDFPQENKFFDMNHSGAYITWVFFNGNDVPLLIKYIEDNDIWIKKMNKTNEVTAALFIEDMTFENFEKMLDEDYIHNVLIKEGEGMVKQNKHHLNMLIKQSCPKFMQIKNKFYFVSFLNSTTLKSEIGNYIFKDYHFSNFSAIYSIDDYKNSTSFSLRSTNDRTNVSEIAKSFGGGGHRNASGIKISLVTSVLPGKIIDNHKSYFLLPTTYFRKLEDYNIIYLNSSHYKHQFAVYLLQNRYNDVQEAQHIYNIRQKEKAPFIDLAIIWNYDGSENNMWYTISFPENMIIKWLQFFESIKEQLNEPKYYNNTIVFSIQGADPHEIESILIKKIEKLSTKILE